MSRIYSNLVRETYINRLMEKVQRQLNVTDIMPAGSLLVLAMRNDIDLDDDEFCCADKARIRCDLESEWVYAHVSFYEELK
jgi:hypothetical protein